MIIGTGIDIVEIPRIRKAVEVWGSRFLERVFNPEEIAYAQKHTIPFPQYAGRFAAKEAVYKAFGDRNLTWKDMTITNSPDGKPHCRVDKPEFDGQIHLSISHSKYYAVASAIIETKKGRT